MGIIPSRDSQMTETIGRSIVISTMHEVVISFGRRYESDEAQTSTTRL